MIKYSTANICAKETHSVMQNSRRIGNTSLYILLYNQYFLNWDIFANSNLNYDNPIIKYAQSSGIS